MSSVTRLLTRGKDTGRIHPEISAYLGRHLMNGIIREMRHGDRAAFAIPGHLAEAAAGVDDPSDDA